MRSFTFTNDGVTITVEATSLWNACGIAAERFATVDHS